MLTNLNQFAHWGFYLTTHILLFETAINKKVMVMKFTSKDYLWSNRNKVVNLGQIQNINLINNME